MRGSLHYVSAGSVPSRLSQASFIQRVPAAAAGSDPSTSMQGTGLLPPSQYLKHLDALTFSPEPSGSPLGLEL